MEGAEGDTEADPNAHTDAALAFFGITLERDPLPPLPSFYLWPENLAPFQFFLALGTQWRVGMEGPTGLDYGVVRSEIDRREGRSARRAATQRREEMFGLVRAMEGGALDGWRQRAQEAREERDREVSTRR